LVNAVAHLSSVISQIYLLKTEFHYASWFGAGWNAKKTSKHLTIINKWTEV